MSGLHWQYSRHKKHSRTIGKAALLLVGRSKARARRWRRITTASVGTAVIVAGIVLQNFAPWFENKNYELSPEVRSIIGDVRDDASEYLKMNESQSAYTFAVPEDTTRQDENHTGRIEDAYSVVMNLDAREGVSLTENTTQVSIKLVPRFRVGEGKKVDGNQVVYPFGKNQLVYSLKYNGLKEDIIVPQFQGDELEYDFDLILPIGVEARLDAQGDIGIYTATGELYGNMTYGSDADRELIERARQNGEKKNLIMTIPAPIVKDAQAKEYSDRSVFILGDHVERQGTPVLPADVSVEVAAQAIEKTTLNVYKLSIRSERLKDLSYPISIDPTIQVDSAADFSNLDLRDGMEIDYAGGLIRRGGLTGGTVSGWSTTTSLPADRLGHAAVAYNGFIYVLGGDAVPSGDQFSTAVYYGKLNVNGSLASDSGCGVTWCVTTPFTGGRRFFAATVHNGFLYISGGNTASSNSTTDLEYAKINTNGTIGSWTATTALPSPRTRHALVAYENYLYIAGGTTAGGTALNTVSYARINADGSLASDAGCGTAWCNTSSFTNNRTNISVTIFNGVFYVIGGGGGGGTALNTVFYARIASDGSLGAFIQTSGMVSARQYANAVFHNGYMYVIGGCGNSPSNVCGSYLNSVEYAPVNSDGSLGAWRTTASIGTARWMSASVVWNGYLYLIGGCGSGNCNAYLDSVEYTNVSSAGALADGNWPTTTGFSNGRRGSSGHVYNGYLYVIGGWASATGYFNTVQYAAISNTGTLGSWTTSGNTLATARDKHASAIYNGYLYVVGGYNGSSALDTIEYAAIATDGSVGAFTTSPNVLPQAKQRLGVVAYKGYLYAVAGGSSGSSNTAYSAALNSNGSIGAWGSAGTLPSNRASLGNNVHAYNGYIYMVGGCTSSCPTYATAVNYAPINSNGTFGTWSTTSSFSTGRENHASVIYNGYLYIIGGDNNVSGNLSDVQRAPINSNGSLGPWSPTTGVGAARLEGFAAAHNGFLYVVGGRNGGTADSNAVHYQVIHNGGSGGPVSFTAGTTLTSARKHHAMVAYNGKIYVAGGCTTSTVCTTATTDVSYATVNDDGSLSAWASTTSTFSTARYGLYAFAHAGRLFIAGGRTTGGVQLTDIQQAPILSNGNISAAWVPDDTSLPTTGSGAAMVLSNVNTLYILGGSSAGTDVSFATISTSTGDVSGWTSTTSLPEARYDLWTAIANDYIYAIGGINSSNPTRTVYYAKVNNDGTVGAWSATSQLNAALSVGSLTATAVQNGYIYIIGGQHSGGAYNRVQFAAVSPGGELGSWQTGNASGLTAHNNYAGVSWRGNLYISGGQVTGTNPTSATRYAAIQATPRIGSFSKLYDFGSAVRVQKVITRGVKRNDGRIRQLYSSSASCGDTLLDNESVAQSIVLGAATATNITTGSNTLVRCLYVRYTLDDSTGALFPDVGNQTYITSIDTLLIANPGSRLRGGRSFINGIDQGLEALPQ